MPEVDLFILFRTMLFVFLGVYSLLLLASTIWRLVALFAGSDPSKQMLRLYVSHQLLTIRFKPVWGELLQIAFWLAILVGLWRLHTLI